MPDRILTGVEPSDLRFQYEVIKGLAESVRQMAASMSDLQKTQIDMLVRLARLEENKVGDDLVGMKAATAALTIRVDALESDKDRRDGAMGALGALRVWGPAICGVLTVLYLAGRAMNVIPSPPTTITKIETPISVERRDDPPHALTTNGAAP
jgi:hypothetical protein